VTVQHEEKFNVQHLMSRLIELLGVTCHNTVPLSHFLYQRPIHDAMLSHFDFLLGTVLPQESSVNDVRVVDEWARYKPVHES
jgi:hypothetical protein